MAYQTPPTFTDNEIISAAQLNILSANQEFLYGITSAINGPFNSIRTGEDLYEANNAYRMRKQGRYLLWRLYLYSGAISNTLEINIHNSTGALVHNLVVNSGGATGPQNWESGVTVGDLAIDLDALSIGTVDYGEIFRVWIKSDGGGQASDFSIIYLFNSTATVVG